MDSKKAWMQARHMVSELQAMDRHTVDMVKPQPMLRYGWISGRHICTLPQVYLHFHYTLPCHYPDWRTNGAPINCHPHPSMVTWPNEMSRIVISILVIYKVRKKELWWETISVPLTGRSWEESLGRGPAHTSFLQLGDGVENPGASDQGSQERIGQGPLISRSWAYQSPTRGLLLPATYYVVIYIQITKFRLRTKAMYPVPTLLCTKCSCGVALCVLFQA